MKPASELDAVRKLILDRASEMRLSLTDLSRALQRNDAYVHQFIWRGSPRRLPELERQALAGALQVPEAALRDGTATHGPLPAPLFGGAEPAKAEIPVYVEGGAFNRAAALEWTARPDVLATANSLSAIWVKRPHGRVQPGDMIYVREGQPPRSGDVVVLIAGGRIEAIGELTDCSEAHATISGTKRKLSADDQLLKVIFVRYA